MIHKTLHRKLTIEQHGPSNTEDELMCSGMVSCSCSTSGITSRIPLATNHIRMHERGRTGLGKRQVEHIHGYV